MYIYSITLLIDTKYSCKPRMNLNHYIYIYYNSNQSIFHCAFIFVNLSYVILPQLFASCLSFNFVINKYDKSLSFTFGTIIRTQYTLLCFFWFVCAPPSRNMCFNGNVYRFVYIFSHITYHDFIYFYFNVK